MQPNERKFTDEEYIILSAFRQMDRKTRRLMKALVLHSLQLSLHQATFEEVKRCYNIPDVSRAGVGA